MSEPIKKIIIVGGGTTGWMAAASLSNYVKDKEISVTLIESPSISTVGVGEATIPNIVEFNRSLGINEVELIKATQATFKLGIEFKDWHKKGERFFHPFADYGMKVNNVDFHHYVNRIKSTGKDVNLQDYSFACLLAKEGRFAQPNPKPNSPLASYHYAYHLDATLYGKYLNKFSVKNGVEHIVANVCASNLHNQSGFIESVTLDDGRQIKGDYDNYIDVVKRQIRDRFSSAELKQKGLQIFTHLDPYIQYRTSQTAQKTDQWLSDQVETAIVVSSSQSGGLLALTGSKNPRSQFNRALLAKRQIGSLIKPFIYLAALETMPGFDLNTELHDEPISIQTPQGP